MPTARRNIGVIADSVRQFEETTIELKTRIGELVKIQTDMNSAAGSAVDSVTDAFGDVRKRMDMAIDEDAAETNEEELDDDMKRRNVRMQLLMDVLDSLSESRVGFWKAQTMSGADAEAEYDTVANLLAGSLQRIREYNTPDNIQDDKTAATFNGIYADVENYRNGVMRVRELSRDISATAMRTIDLYKSIDGTVTAASAASAAAMNENSRNILAGMANIEKTVGSYRMLVLGTAVAALVIGLVIATLLIRNITLPISHIIETLTNGSAQINAASDQIASASRNLAEGATSQAASLEETSSALEEMASMTRQNADNAQKTNDTTMETARMVTDGAEAVNNMTVAMADISDKSEKVERIVKTIEDIAFQTNLLALNAAVEAAHAGRYGKGFSVVAEEVRTLSAHSSKAAAEARREVTLADQQMDAAVEKARNTAEVLAAISESTKDVSQAVDTVRDSSNEQLQGVRQANANMERIAAIANQGIVEARRIASTTTMLSEMAGQLNALLDKSEYIKKPSNLSNTPNTSNNDKASGTLIRPRT